MQDNFEHFYVDWYSRAKHFAQEYVLVEKDAENIVQDTFLKIYEQWDSFDEDINLTSYLFTSLKNRSLKMLRRNIVAEKAKSSIQKQYVLETKLRYDSLETFNIAFSDERSIEDLLHEAIGKLPPKCREIFIMSKIEGKKQAQIAQELGISVNTIEVQIGIAYKKLRQELKDYMPLLLFLFSTV